MKHKFKMPCCICGRWSNEYEGMNDKIVCDQCQPNADKYFKKLAEQNMKYEQTNIFDYLNK